MTELVRVETKSGWLSKINWTQAIAIVASVLVVVTGGKINLDPETQVAIVTFIQAAQGIVTFILKTWFTPTITPASAARDPYRTMTLD